MDILQTNTQPESTAHNSKKKKKSQSSSDIPNQQTRYVFVTVGTTRFDKLISSITSVPILNLLQKMGFNAILMQIGAGELPSIGTELNLEKDKDKSLNSILEHQKYDKNEAQNNSGIKIYYYRSKKSIANDIKNATLIISHAGTGTIIETLSLHQPLIVVINNELMNNHQLEIAVKLAELGYIDYVPSPDKLVDFLTKYKDNKQKTRKVLSNTNNDIFPNFLDRVVEKSSTRNIKTLVILGSGGHTSEMLRMLKGVDRDKYKTKFVIANSDSYSENQLADFIGTISPEEWIDRLPRSRNVGQSYFTSIFTTIIAFFFSIILFFKEMPDIILCNGPGTCVPLCIVALIMRCLFIKKSKIIYVESLARVQTLSLSGKILYHVADYFLVQWNQLKIIYPKSEYLGILI